jgi:hypothetical protein
MAGRELLGRRLSLLDRGAREEEEEEEGHRSPISEEDYTLLNVSHNDTKLTGYYSFTDTSRQHRLRFILWCIVNGHFPKLYNGKTELRIQ